MKKRNRMPGSLTQLRNMLHNQMLSQIDNSHTNSFWTKLSRATVVELYGSLYQQVGRKIFYAKT